VVDIWHCDAVGSYSGFEEEGTFLRGTQVTDAVGVVEFTTVYPGWYRGRTVHIHAKVHLDKRTALTTQLYFDEQVTAAVYEREPYSADTGRDTFNDSDGIFDERTVLSLSREGSGYRGVISLDVERT
jgi:protocatechuate 3,4-dioxygenase beta subunit